MKKLILLFLILFLLSACAPQNSTAEDPPAPDLPVEDAPVPEDSPPQEPAAPLHSPLYLEGVSAEDAILWFNEVCLDAEVTNGGDAHLVQKWTEPIVYRLFGSPTDVDIRTLEAFVFQVNRIEGFPGMREAKGDEAYDLDIHFCTGEELVNIMGPQFSALDYGAVTFWYDSENAIFEATICCRSDIEQSERCSVIPEELYNCLGPVQDTILRQDSLIYQYSNETQSMTAEDRLILQLLYHGDVLRGMTAEECETVIRELYY